MPFEFTSICNDILSSPMRRRAWGLGAMQYYRQGCQDTSDPGHFGPKTFRHQCRSVHKTVPRPPKMSWDTLALRKILRHCATQYTGWQLRWTNAFVIRRIRLIQQRYSLFQYQRVEYWSKCVTRQWRSQKFSTGGCINFFYHSFLPTPAQLPYHSKRPLQSKNGMNRLYEQLHVTRNWPQ